ncbi:MAG: D-cysteine desulfhydrase family protein [Chloroflexi bacterium]|nr:D-cysteine desulfhydrase family protein [Chloroflexota bacterium]
MLKTTINPVALGHYPTPLHELPRLSRGLGGPRLFVKRDDLTGLALGGNKTRKLGLLLADALQQRADTLVTMGAPQSNHARQTAAAAAQMGLGAVLVLTQRAPAQLNGNLLLDRLLGARVRWAGDRDPLEVLDEVAAEERAAGRRPYVIPYGGSNALGASAYALALEELVQQSRALQLSFDCIVTASSSGGTQAGLVAGARALGESVRILGISVDKPAEALRDKVQNLAQVTLGQLGETLHVRPEDVLVNDDYLGGGYAVLGEPEREAIGLAARSEGLLLDPVYTGRAMAGLIDLIRRRTFTAAQCVLFWHTGGAPALFAYADQLR